MVSLANGGWIKLYRELRTKCIWLDATPEQKVILITILLMANYEEKKWIWKGKQFVCKPGQFVTSIKSLVRECGLGISDKNVRTALAKFEKLGFLTDESANRGRLITIVNWQDYQGRDGSAGKDSGREPADRWQSGGKELATTKKKDDKKVEEGKECVPNDDVEGLNLWDEE